MHYGIKQCMSSATGEFGHTSILALVAYMQEKAKCILKESLSFSTFLKIH